MADDFTKILSSAEQIAFNHEKYKDKYVDSSKDMVNADTFLKLLVAEMTKQDPLEPSSNTEFVSQLATFTSMGYMQDASKYSMANYASSLVGKTATAARLEGKEWITKTGVVESVQKVGDSYNVTIGGEVFDLSKITSVVDAGKSENTNSSSSSAAVDPMVSLGDSISRAALMVGMFATVSGGQGETAYVDQGFIESITVKDGKISVVINGTGRPITDIVEVTYATVSDKGQELSEEESGEVHNEAQAVE